MYVFLLVFHSKVPIDFTSYMYICYQTLTTNSIMGAWAQNHCTVHSRDLELGVVRSF